MASFGRNPFPRTFGGDTRPYAQEHQALLTALEPGYSTDPDGANYAELLAAAVGLGFMWAANRRMSNQFIPSKMTDWLTTWEKACSITPVPGSTLIQRRALVAAKFRGIINNALPDVADAAKSLAGDSYVGVAIVEPADGWSYWPVENPGPPGFEWSSSNAITAVELTYGSQTPASYAALVQAVLLMLYGMLPAWGDAVVGDTVRNLPGTGVCSLTLVVD